MIKVQALVCKKLEEEGNKSCFVRFVSDDNVMHSLIWFPKLKELALILRTICESEDVLYPRERGLEGRKRTIRYITDAMNGADIEMIGKREKLPE